VASRAKEATREAILATAGEAFASRESVNMAELAARAGVARGTLYRHFPTRRALLDALEEAAREEANRRLTEAKLDRVVVEEALARAVRALVSLGERVSFLPRTPQLPLSNDRDLLAPIVGVLERGREQGQIRTDVPVSCLVESLLALIGACIRSGKAGGMGSEDISSTALRLFLGGARPESH
jgi:TetR/AcrR family transcriptional regulator, mexCD-oprJ operon repressor